MPGNIFYFVYSQYIDDTKNSNGRSNEMNKSIPVTDTNTNIIRRNEIEKISQTWVSRYEVLERHPSIVSKIITFLNNETFMDIIS